jgi:hypothetical protein
VEEAALTLVHYQLNCTQLPPPRLRVLLLLLVLSPGH